MKQLDDYDEQQQKIDQITKELDDYKGQRDKADQIISTGFLAISIVLLQGIISASSVDFLLECSIIFLSIAIPANAFNIIIQTLANIKSANKIKLNIFQKYLYVIGWLAACLAIGSTIAHTSIIAGWVFLIFGSICAFSFLRFRTKVDRLMLKENNEAIEGIVEEIRQKKLKP